MRHHRLAAAALAGGLALSAAACEAEADIDAPAITDPAAPNDGFDGEPDVELEGGIEGEGELDGN